MFPSKSCLVYTAKYDLCTADPPNVRPDTPLLIVWTIITGNFTHMSQGCFVGTRENSFDCLSTSEATLKNTIDYWYIADKHNTVLNTLREEES